MAVSTRDPRWRTGADGAERSNGLHGTLMTSCGSMLRPPHLTNGLVTKRGSRRAAGPVLAQGAIVYASPVAGCGDELLLYCDTTELAGNRMSGPVTHRRVPSGRSEWDGTVAYYIRAITGRKLITIAPICKIVNPTTTNAVGPRLVGCCCRKVP